MSYHCVPVDDDEDIRQGDIIRRLPASAAESPVWGFILTADCDIANRKASESFTWLKIVPAGNYLEESWAVEQLRRLIEKQSKVAAEGISGLITRAGLELSRLTTASLCDWLKNQSAEDILRAANATGGPTNAKLLGIAQALRVALGHEGPPSQLERLQTAWTMLGRDLRS